jgi:UDP-N-acetyl-D-mannosaminuronic acid dehydrogenase
MENNFQKISIIGLGYIGLPTGTMFAENGLDVVGVDINGNIVDKVNGGEIHIVEPDLEEKVGAAVASGKLYASTMVEESDAFIIAVPTSFGENHKPDISFVEAVARSIAPALGRGDLVMLESTSPVGTTFHIAELMGRLCPDLKFPHREGGNADIHIAYRPE